MAQKTVSLAPGQSTEVAFEVTPTVAKTYQVSVGGLSGSFVAKTAPVGVQITSISLDKTQILPAEAFTITFTFSNPNNFDVYIRPKFAFGQANGDTFTADEVLAGLSWSGTEMEMDARVPAAWVNLGHPSSRGSGMTQTVKDGDGISVIVPGGGSAEYWLKVPAGGQATTSRAWTLTSKDFEYGMRDVCVEVPNPFYLVYDPGWAVRIVGGVTYTLNWRPVALDAFTGVVNDIATIGLSPEAVTIDKLEIQIVYATNRLNTRVTITNNTGKTLISRPSDWIYTRLSIKPFTAETFQRLHSAKKGTYTTLNPGDSIMSYLLAQKSAGSGSSIGNIPPGTTTMSFSMTYGGGGINPDVSYVGADSVVRLLPLSQAIPEGLAGYAWVAFTQVDQRPMDYIYGGKAEAGFKGIFSSQWQTWTKIPFRIDKIPVWEEYYIEVFVEL